MWASMCRPDAVSCTGRMAHQSASQPFQQLQSRYIKPRYVRHAAAADGAAAAPVEPAGSTDASAPPTFTLDFETDDGLRTLEGIESGDILRDVMLGADPKVPLYTTWGAMSNCNGGGQCGTCIVQILEGSEFLDERSDAEEGKLKKKPVDFRLACQLNVGDGDSSGRMKFRTKPK